MTHPLGRISTPPFSTTVECKGRTMRLSRQDRPKATIFVVCTRPPSFGENPLTVHACLGQRTAFDIQASASPTFPRTCLRPPPPPLARMVHSPGSRSTQLSASLTDSDTASRCRASSLRRHRRPPCRLPRPVPPPRPARALTSCTTPTTPRRTGRGLPPGTVRAAGCTRAGHLPLIGR